MPQDDLNKTPTPQAPSDTPVPSMPDAQTQDNATVTPAPAAPSQVPVKYGGRKIIATIFGIALLLIGSISTVVLVQRQQIITGRAWDCSKYVFELSKEGALSVRNGSSRNEPSQKADVFINGSLVKTVDVPALPSGQAASLGNISVPTGTFTWKVDGKSDCENSGTHIVSPTPPAISASCGEVKAYDTNWNALSVNDLSKLKAGSVVRLAVSGTASSGVFEKAKFTVNGTVRNEVSLKKPGSEEFYDEYTIPSGTTNFAISAQVHHNSLGWL